MGESCILARGMGIRAGALREKGGLHTEGMQIPRRIGWASKKSLPRTRRKHEQVRRSKSSPGRSAESWFYSKSGQILNGKGGGQTKSPLIR